MENLTSERIDELIEIFEMSENNLEKIEELNSEIKTYLNDENFNSKYNEIKTMYEKMDEYIKENETTKSEIKNHIDILNDYNKKTLQMKKGIFEIKEIFENMANSYNTVNTIKSILIPIFALNVITTLIIMNELWKLF